MTPSAGSPVTRKLRAKTTSLPSTASAEPGAYEARNEAGAQYRQSRELVFGLERLSENLTCTVQPPPNAGFRRVDDFRNAFTRDALRLVQDEHGPIPIRQLGQRG